MTTYKFLIDECLSPELAEMAVQRGHVESTCVRNRGWSGLKDYQLIQRVVAEDFTLVTCNSVDFRGKGPGELGGEHANVDIHAGLCASTPRSRSTWTSSWSSFKPLLRCSKRKRTWSTRPSTCSTRKTGNYDIYDIPAAHEVAAGQEQAPAQELVDQQVNPQPPAAAAPGSQPAAPGAL